MMPDISEVLVVLALVFLGLHLLTDARRLVLTLLTQHSRKAHKVNLAAPAGTSLMPCPRCGVTKDTLKEAWWEVLTFMVLIGHITLDYI